MNKQIEELAKDLEEIEKEQGHKLLNETLLYVNKNHRYNLKEDYSLAHKKTIYELTAEELINLGYQKVDKNKQVVLSKEEYEELKHFKAKMSLPYCNIRKETAREIFQRLFEEHNAFNENDVIVVWQVKEVFTEIAKQYGVEIKE